MRVEKYGCYVNGYELILRNPEEEDAAMLLEGFKIMCGETRNLLKEPEEIRFTLEEEQNFIQSMNHSRRNLMLLGMYNGEYVGNCSLMGMAPMRQQHRGTLGIALYQKYTGMGIGTIMLKQLLSHGREMGLEQVELEVVAENKRAIALYQKMGFQIYGEFPNNMKYQDGSCANAYWMMKRL